MHFEVTYFALIDCRIFDFVGLAMEIALFVARLGFVGWVKEIEVTGWILSFVGLVMEIALFDRKLNFFELVMEIESFG